MKIRILTIAALAVTTTLSVMAKDRLLLLGDIHLDRIENHDMEWLVTRGDNLRQVTKEYTVWTRDNFPALASTIGDVADKSSAVIQLGDLSEGLAGNPVKAAEMAHDAFATIDSIGLDIPFIITKGNHDITGPGAKEAFRDVYLPSMTRLSKHSEPLSTATYATTIGNDILVVCYDPWDKKSTPSMLDSLLKSSTARYKFVAVHEPIIPVNHRCWHVYRKDSNRREQLLETIARNSAIVLCAHLHKYSVVSRNTPWGPIVQILVNSVVRNLNRQSEPKIFTTYGQSMFEGHESWERESLDQRRQWIESETPCVTFYRYADIPGYATIDIDGDELILNYYYGAETTPIDTVNISKINQ